MVVMGFWHYGCDGILALWLWWDSAIIAVMEILPIDVVLIVPLDAIVRIVPLWVIGFCHYVIVGILPLDVKGVSVTILLGFCHYMGDRVLPLRLWEFCHYRCDGGILPLIVMGILPLIGILPLCG